MNYEMVFLVEPDHGQLNTISTTIFTTLSTTRMKDEIGFLVEPDHGQLNALSITRNYTSYFLVPTSYFLLPIS